VESSRGSIYLDGRPAQVHDVSLGKTVVSAAPAAALRPSLTGREEWLLQTQSVRLYCPEQMWYMMVSCDTNYCKKYKHSLCDKLYHSVYRSILCLCSLHNFILRYAMNTPNCTLVAFAWVMAGLLGLQARGCWCSSATYLSKIISS
jgi:hypothetical protein